MADLTSRQPSWADYLPAEWQSAINMSPLINALSGYINRRPADIEGASNRIFAQPGDREAQDRNWLLQQARGPSALERMNPVAQDGVNKLGILANFFGPGAKLPAMAPKPTGIRAYHGSPHDFDRFDISKIGTGEGAQAYGRGLYFAENEGVARSYRDALSDNVDKIAARARFHRILNEIDQAQRTDPSSHRVKLRADVEAAMARLEEIPPAGRMYEVNIKADPDQFLDWDKPLSQQPEGVRKTIEPALKAAALDLGKGASPEVIARFEAMGLKNVADRMRPKEIDPWSLDTVTLAQQYPNALREAGIPGIKYLDQGSRAAGQGSRNFVVFDDALVTILRKYGLLPPAAVAAAGATNGGLDDGLAP